MTIDRSSYDADFDYPELPPGAYETYVRPLADLHEQTARQPRDVILLLAIRETFAHYGAASATDDEREYLTEGLARILVPDSDGTVDPEQSVGFLNPYRDEHDPARREVESFDGRKRAS